MKRLALTLAASLGILGSALSAMPASAQQMNGGMGGWRSYSTWQPGWDQGRYDRRHVIIGRVTKFSPYRVTISRRNGNRMTVDLKPGTVIRPIGATPTAGDRVAMVGYWSNGTYIVNRLILH